MRPAGHKTRSRDRPLKGWDLLQHFPGFHLPCLNQPPKPYHLGGIEAGKTGDSAMEVQFRGGPWDGVLIKTRSLPDQVRLQSLAVQLGAEVRPTGDFPDNACYWLRTPYNRDVYYEFEACGAASSPAAAASPPAEIARLLAKRSALEP